MKRIFGVLMVFVVASFFAEPVYAQTEAQQPQDGYNKVERDTNEHNLIAFVTVNPAVNFPLREYGTHPELSVAVYAEALYTRNKWEYLLGYTLTGVRWPHAQNTSDTDAINYQGTLYGIWAYNLTDWMGVAAIGGRNIFDKGWDDQFWFYGVGPYFPMSSARVNVQYQRNSFQESQATISLIIPFGKTIESWKTIKYKGGKWSTWGY